MQIKDYIDSNKERFLDELYDLLRIESVSADPKFKDSVDRAADYLVDQFNKLNLDAVEKIKNSNIKNLVITDTIDNTQKVKKSRNIEILSISNAVYDEEWINLIRPTFQDYLDGLTKIPYYIHPGGDLQEVGGTSQITLDSSFYKQFIENLFNKVDNLIDIDFELWDHYNGSLIDIYACLLYTSDAADE